MSHAFKRLEMTDALHHYLQANSLREHPALQRLREATADHPRANMQIAPEQGQFMALLVQLTHAKKVLEIGTFTGYSALAVALALPEDGQVTACDLSDDFTRIGRPYWAEADVAHKIDLRIAPALDTLDALLSAGATQSYDFAFIDADKTNYDAYYERTLRLLRPGGLLLIDNVLWSGKVADPTQTDPDTNALRALNAKIHRDPRITLSMLPIADGLTLVRKSEGHPLTAA